MEPPPKESLRGRTSKVNYRISVDDVNLSSTDKHTFQAGQIHWRTALARQIEHTDAEIDRLVYELYGLTVEEVALVEEAAK